MESRGPGSHCVVSPLQSVSVPTLGTPQRSFWCYSTLVGASGPNRGKYGRALWSQTPNSRLMASFWPWLPEPQYQPCSNSYTSQGSCGCHRRSVCSGEVPAQSLGSWNGSTQANTSNFLWLFSHFYNFPSKVQLRQQMKVEMALWLISKTQIFF